MSYTFYLTTRTARQYLSLTESYLDNVYIDNTAKGSANTFNKSLHAWTSRENPIATTNGYSKPIKLYHSQTSRFLGNTEQRNSISNSGAATGEVAGTIIYSCPDNALEFVFKISGSDYKIYLSENADPLQNTKMLCYDRTNNNRVMITDFEDFIPSSSLDNIWTYAAFY